MPPKPHPYLTPEEYLAIERQADYKSEYRNGEMFAMAGASEAHNTLVANILYLLVGQFKGRNCQAYSNDLRVKISPTGLYTYPDIVAVCGERNFEDQKQDTLLNPTVLIEVLSASTEAYDRGEKFEHYRSLESLSDYLLISQSKPKIEHFMRQPNNLWVLSESHGLKDSIGIASISCTLALADVYDKVSMAGDEEHVIIRRIE